MYKLFGMVERSNAYTNSQAQLRAYERAGLEFVGRIEQLRLARQRVFDMLQGEKGLLGHAVYFVDPDHPAEIGVMDQASCSVVSEDHERFIDAFLKRRRLVAADTSVGAVLISRQSSISPSKMLEHDCCNIFHDTANGPLVFQFVFSKGAAVNLSTLEAFIRDAKDEHQPSMLQAAEVVMNEYGHNVARNLGLNAPHGQRNGVVVSTDISGSTKILSYDNEVTWNQHLQNWVQEMERVAVEFGGRFFREAGDGGSIGFPLNDDRALHVMRELQERYKNLKIKDHMMGVEDSLGTGTHLRVAVSTGYFDASLKGGVFQPNPDILVTGLPLLWAACALSSGSRDRDVSLLTPDAMAYFALRFDFEAVSVKTGSTAMPYAHEVSHWGPSGL